MPKVSSKSKPSRLGKGVHAIFDGIVLDAELGGSGGANGAGGGGAVSLVPMEQLYHDESQPRKAFDQTQIEELAESIRSVGIIQPLIVEERKSGGYTIIAGERRYRAALHAKLESVPAVVRSYGVTERLKVQLIENIQRSDLNPLEIAQGYQVLLDKTDMSHQELADGVGKSRSNITNMIRLLGLPQDVKELVRGGNLSTGHARCLLALKQDKQIEEAAQKVITQRLSVRQTEAMIAHMAQSTTENGQRSTSSARKRLDEAADAMEIANMAQQLSDIFLTKVDIKGNRNAGTIQIRYYSLNDLNRLTTQLKACAD